MNIPNRNLVKNCWRCGINVVIDRRKLVRSEIDMDEEFFCPKCDAYIGRLVMDKEKKYIDISP